MSAQRPRSASLRQPSRALLHTGAALLIASALLVSAHASISAHLATQPLPILRLNYLVGTRPLLANGALDPIQAISDLNTEIPVNANLVQILPNGRVVPDLATWTVSKNRLVYTFTVRKSARFSNGHSVTARDVAFSLKRALAPLSASALAPLYLTLIRGADAFNVGKTHTLSGVKVVDKRVLQITITRPAAYFLAALAYPTADVLDPSVVAGKVAGPKNNYLSTTCVGNQGAGPFEFVCRDRSSNPQSFYSGHSPVYTLVPNPYYYGRKPRLTLELPVLPVEAEYKQYLAGKLDMSGIPQPFLNRWRGTSREFHEYPSSEVDYLAPNTHLAPFDNVHCRLALAYAIDRETIANNVLGGLTRATYAVVPRGMLGYYAGRDNPHYDPSRARAELAKCPERTAPFGLVYDNSSPGNGNEFGAIGTELSAIGMNVELKPLPHSDWNAIVTQPLEKTHTQLAATFWSQDYPDPQDYCTLLLRSGQSTNVGGWHDNAYDRLVDRADRIVNRAERVKLYIQAQHIALSQGAFISLTNGDAYSLIKPYVRGLIGTEAYSLPGPKDHTWANVSVSKH